MTKGHLVPPFAFLLALMCMFAGTYGHAAQSRALAKTSSPGRAIAVRLGQTAVLTRERLRIKFNSVVGDSRCPTGVTCVWEGDAEIQLVVNRANDAASTLRLHTNQRFAQQELYQGYAITLLNLAPYPRSGTQHRPDDYIATVSVKAE